MGSMWRVQKDRAVARQVSKRSSIGTHLGASAATARPANAEIADVRHMKVATCAIILLAAASLLPTLLVDIPAMADYLNHLARMYVLSDAGTLNENPYHEVT